MKVTKGVISYLTQTMMELEHQLASLRKEQRDNATQRAAGSYVNYRSESALADDVNSTTEQIAEAEVLLAVLQERLK